MVAAIANPVVEWKSISSKPTISRRKAHRYSSHSISAIIILCIHRRALSSAVWESQPDGYKSNAFFEEYGCSQIQSTQISNQAQYRAHKLCPFKFEEELGGRGSFPCFHVSQRAPVALLAFSLIIIPVAITKPLAPSVAQALTVFRRLFLHSPFLCNHDPASLQFK